MSTMTTQKSKIALHIPVTAVELNATANEDSLVRHCLLIDRKELKLFKKKKEKKKNEKGMVRSVLFLRNANKILTGFSCFLGKRERRLASRD